MDSQPQLRTEDLLSEQMSDAEVRTLLERLGSKEFGGSESATVGAVVEATGTDVEIVGRLLAEIRKENFEKRFGLQLKDHGRRIDTLEQIVTDSRARVEAKPFEGTLYEPFNYPKTDVDPMSPSEMLRGGLHRSLIILAAVLVLVATMYFRCSIR